MTSTMEDIQSLSSVKPISIGFKDELLSALAKSGKNLAEILHVIFPLRNEKGEDMITVGGKQYSNNENSKTDGDQTRNRVKELLDATLAEKEQAHAVVQDIMMKLRRARELRNGSERRFKYLADIAKGYRIVPSSNRKSFAASAAAESFENLGGFRAKKRRLDSCGEDDEEVFPVKVMVEEQEQHHTQEPIIGLFSCTQGIPMVKQEPRNKPTSSLSLDLSAWSAYNDLTSASSSRERDHLQEAVDTARTDSELDCKWSDCRSHVTTISSGSPAQHPYSPSPTLSALRVESTTKGASSPENSVFRSTTHGSKDDSYFYTNNSQRSDYDHTVSGTDGNLNARSQSRLDLFRSDTPISNIASDGVTVFDAISGNAGDFNAEETSHLAYDFFNHRLPLASKHKHVIETSQSNLRSSPITIQTASYDHSRSVSGSYMSARNSQPSSPSEASDFDADVSSYTDLSFIVSDMSESDGGSSFVLSDSDGGSSDGSSSGGSRSDGRSSDGSSSEFASGSSEDMVVDITDDDSE